MNFPISRPVGRDQLSRATSWPRPVRLCDQLAATSALRPVGRDQLAATSRACPLSYFLKCPVVCQITKIDNCYTSTAANPFSQSNGRRLNSNQRVWFLWLIIIHYPTPPTPHYTSTYDFVFGSLLPITSKFILSMRIISSICRFFVWMSKT